jgi:hypothetical protein
MVIVASMDTGISNDGGRAFILLGTAIPIFITRHNLLMISRIMGASGAFYHVSHYAYQG